MKKLSVTPEDRNVVKCPNKYIFKSCTDQSKPFGYQNSDLKNLYISSKALESLDY